MLLKNAKILQNGEFVTRDILINGTKIEKISEKIQDIEDKEDKVIDLKNNFLTPGLIDVHVHFREPGFSYKETIKTGTMAAARGGYTTVMTMPNLNPVSDSLEHLKLQLDIIEKDAVIRVIPYASITKEQKGAEFVDFEQLSEHIFAFSDDGRGVQDANMMYIAMKKAKELNKAVVCHSEENSLIWGGCMNFGKKSKELGKKGIPSICESVQIARDILLAEYTKCHYHVCHVSTKESVRIIRDAKRAGINVTCEVTPHHLLSTEDDINTTDGKWKMNPPLRTKEDREALVEGLIDGTIDIIATDHAPHSKEEKEIDIEKAAFGIVGLESAFSQLYTHFVKKGVFSLEFLVDKMSKNVSKTFNLPFSKLEVGENADITVIDLEKKSTIDPSNFLSKGKNTPYAGQEVCGIPILTIYNGDVVYKDFI